MILFRSLLPGRPSAIKEKSQLGWFGLTFVWKELEVKTFILFYFFLPLKNIFYLDFDESQLENIKVKSNLFAGTGKSFRVLFYLVILEPFQQLLWIFYLFFFSWLLATTLPQITIQHQCILPKAFYARYLNYAYVMLTKEQSMSLWDIWITNAHRQNNK